MCARCMYKHIPPYESHPTTRVFVHTCMCARHQSHPVTRVFVHTCMCARYKYKHIPPYESHPVTRVFVHTCMCARHQSHPITGVFVHTCMCARHQLWGGFRMEECVCTYGGICSYMYVYLAHTYMYEHIPPYVCVSRTHSSMYVQTHSSSIRLASALT